MLSSYQPYWFQDTQAENIAVNDIAVRIRAGILFIIPLFMGLTLYDVSYTYIWLVDSNTIVDTYETDAKGRILYTAAMTRRTYEYSLQTGVLFYALFEMLAGLFVWSARFSPTIWLSSFLARQSPPVWKPLAPKRFAWLIAASLISICLIFFNPDTFAGWVNSLFGSELLPTTENFLPKSTGIVLVLVCLSFMWLEIVLGFCVGCQVHALLVRLGILKERCDACNTIDWGEMARKKNEAE